MSGQLIIGVSGKKRHGKGTWSQPLLDQGFVELAFADPLRHLVEAQNPFVYGGAAGTAVRLSQVAGIDEWVETGRYPAMMPAEYVGEVGRLLTATQRSGSDLIVELADAAVARRFLRIQDPLLGGYGRDLITYNALVDAVGYTAAKNAEEVRRYLQVTGTEAGRRLIRDSVWVDIAMAKSAAADAHVVLSDCRFPNEAAAVRAAGGLLVRVERPDLAADSDEHPSETALDDWDDWDHVAVNSGTVPDLEQDALAFLARVQQPNVA